MEIERRCQVGNSTDGVDILSPVVLDEVGMLGLYEESDVIVVFLHPMSQGEAEVMGIVLVFGIAAQVLVKEFIHMVIDRPEPRVPFAVFWHDTREDVLR